VNEAVAFAKEAGYGSVFLETIKELPAAAALYRSVGFELVQEQAVRRWGRAITEQRYEVHWEAEVSASGGQGPWGARRLT
jgi:ribosomal protein S18 acetylase RimI-like enzyme